jgi:hypothetical protein
VASRSKYHPNLLSAVKATREAEKACITAVNPCLDRTKHG